MSRIICAKSEDALSKLQSDSFDLLCTDPPYGMNFMGKEWDKALPDKKIWKECFRVLKPGAFAFVMCIPRADCLWRMMRDLELARFIVKFTPMYWTYASGFPKANNLARAIDKKLGSKSKLLGRKKKWIMDYSKHMSKMPGCIGGYGIKSEGSGLITTPTTREAKELDGSYGGFQPKPAVEVIIVAMKPLSEKNYIEQARKNKKGITWLDDCRIPLLANDKIVEMDAQKEGTGNKTFGQGGRYEPTTELKPQGRFPANLLVQDDVLNDGRQYDSGSFSRYFDLDRWFSEMLKQRLGSKFERAAKTFPFLISTKASKQEKWFYCRVCKSTQEAAREKEHHSHIYWCKDCQEMISFKKIEQCRKQKHKLVPNIIYHPTVKPLKLMAYLVTLGSREGDKVLDPFAGTCKTAMACEILKRNCVMIDSDSMALMLGRAGIDAINNPPLRKKLLKRIEE